MRRWLRVIPVLLMGALAIAYVLARPSLAPRVPYLVILEYPVGALLVGLLLWAALARSRPQPPEPFRRHEQVVRVLADPALAPDLRAIERWLETGEGAEAAADVIARARSNDAHAQERARGEILSSMRSASSRRKRGSLLKHESRTGA